MAFRVPFLFLLMQLIPDVHRSKPLTTRHRLCLCGDRVLRIQFTNDKESSFVSCDQRCADENNKGISWTGSRFRLRKRRELSEEQQACQGKARSDPRWIINDLNVTFHDRENSSRWYARVSWNPFTANSLQHWKGYCLSYGRHGSPFVYSSYVLKNLTSAKISPQWEERKVYLAVVVLPVFANYSQNETGIFFNKYPTRRPDPILRPDFTPFTLTFPTEKESSNTTAYVSISLGILAGLALVSSFLVYFFRQKKPGIPVPSDFKYHAFIIYSYKDILWLQNKLLPLLEEKHHLTCCVDYRDFVPGKPFVDNMADSVENSYKIIALFSKNTENSVYFPFELGLAIKRLAEKRDRSLIVIRIDNVDSGLLPSELQKRTFVDYYDIQQRPFWKQRLLKFLDLPEVSRTNSTTEDQSCDNGIDRDYPGDETENKTKVRFNRLESTTSNDSVISYL